MSKAATFNGPMARKKKVGQKYSPNSYRVISQEAEKNIFGVSRKFSAVKQPDVNLLGQKSTTKEPDSDEHRHNRPNPRHVGFLRQDVRLLNEPVCDVHTSSTEDEQHVWWNHKPSAYKPSELSYTLDTTGRDNYQYRGSGLKGNSRHSANPNTEATRGAVPVTMMRRPDGRQRVLQEGLSYEHQYNCRLDPSYPVRAKRHGSFVWNEVPTTKVEQMLRQNGITPSHDVNDSKPAAETPKQEVVSQQQPEIIHSEPLSPAINPIPVLPPIGAL